MYWDICHSALVISLSHQDLYTSKYTSVDVDILSLQLCINTFEGYECDCRHGYTLNEDHRTCGDLDECQLHNGGCEQKCMYESLNSQQDTIMSLEMWAEMLVR